MRNDVVTWAQLLSPNKELECRLRELFAEFSDSCCDEKTLELKLEGTKLMFGFCNNYKSIDIKDICKFCSTCIEVPSVCIDVTSVLVKDTTCIELTPSCTEVNTLCMDGNDTQIYKVGSLPVTAFPGQTIFVEDMQAVDGSMGTMMFWQPSTQQWKRISM